MSDEFIERKNHTSGNRELTRRQLEEAERAKLDYSKVDTDLMRDAKVVRKRHQAHEALKESADVDYNSEEEDKFGTDLLEAVNKTKVRRQKKHRFTESGLPIEPFSLDQEIRNRELSNEGGMILARERRKLLEEVDEQDILDDPWLRSVDEEQKKMLYNEARRHDSGSEESEDEDINEKQVEEEEKLNAKKWEEEQKAHRLSPDDMIELKRKMVAFLLPSRGKRESSAHQAQRKEEGRRTH